MQYQSVSSADVEKVISLDLEKNHFLVAIAGGTLQLCWSYFDFLITPGNWQMLFYMRTFTFALPIILFLFRKRFNVNATWCLFFEALSISLLTAYGSSIVNVDEFRQFSMAYLIFFVGVGMLVIWKLRFSFYLLFASVLANIVFVQLNGSLTFSQFTANGGMAVFTVACLSGVMIYSRYRSRFNEVMARLELANSLVLVEEKTRENTALNEQLHQIEKTALVGEMSSSIAHELNTPLAIVRNGSMALKESVDHILTLTNSNDVQDDLTFILKELAQRTSSTSSFKRIREAKRMKENLLEKGITVDDELLDLLSISGLRNDDVELLNRIFSHAEPSVFIRLIKHMRDIDLMSKNVVESVSRTTAIVNELKSFVQFSNTSDKTTVDLKESLEKAIRITQQTDKFSGSFELEMNNSVQLYTSEIGLIQLWIKLFDWINSSCDKDVLEKLVIKVIDSHDQTRVRFTIPNYAKSTLRELYQINSIFQQASEDQYDFSLNILRTLIAELKVEMELLEDNQENALQLILQK